MSGKVLILLTNSYPYGYGESFIETEIKYLSDVFDDIVIFPFRKIDHIRNIPKNVKVENLLTEKSKLYIFFNFIIKTLREKEFKDEIKKYQGNKIFLNFIRTLLFYCKSLYINQTVDKFLGSRISNKNIIIYTYWMTSAAYGLGGLKKKYPKCKLVSRAHGYDLYAERYLTRCIPMQYKTISNLDKLFLVSNDGYQYLCSKYKNEFVNKFVVSRLGVKKIAGNTNKLNPENTDSKLFQLVTCSTFAKVKRIDLLIDVLSILNNRIQVRKIKWHHIGGGENQTYFEKLAKNKLTGQVDFEFHGMLTHSQVLQLYKNVHFDLFINMSDSEGIPVSIMEAFSFGIPVMARNVGGISEIVSNENGVLLDDVVSAEEIAQALLGVINTEDELLKKRQSAVDCWASLFNADINYKKFVYEISHL